MFVSFGHIKKAGTQPKETPMAMKDLLITEELVNHMRAAFPEEPYKPGMTLDEVAYAAGQQKPIRHLELILQKRNARGR